MLRAVVLLGALAACLAMPTLEQNFNVSAPVDQLVDPSSFHENALNNPFPEARISAPLFHQCGESYSNNQLGTCSKTICQAGCAMSSVAMGLDSRGLSQNPGTLNAWLKSNGGYASGCEIVWGSVDRFGKSSFQGVETASEGSICSGLANGHIIVANVRGGSHWVLLTGCRGGGVYDVHDPGFNQATYTHGEVLREAVYH